MPNVAKSSKIPLNWLLFLPVRFGTNDIGVSGGKKKNIVVQSYNSNMNRMVFGEFGINPSLLPAAATKCPAQTSQFQSLRKTFGHEREYLDSYVPFCK